MEQGGLESDTLVVLPTTAPLRDVADVSQAMTLAANSKADVVVTVTAAHRSPWFNMVTVDSRQRAVIVMKDRAGVVFRRQDSPDVFDLTAVAYVTNLGYVLSAANMFAGDVVASVVPPERAIDIDTELDLEIAEFLHHRKENGA
jgi:CMP-N-acetylneuraminic acid synthetase